MGSLENFNFSKLNRLIETGTGEGLSVWLALNNGAQEVKTVEECLNVYRTCWAHFKDDPRVSLNLGKSVKFLREIDDFKNAVVFLDAHFIGGADYGFSKFSDSAKEQDSFPLIEELEVLLSKDTKSTAIVIDDARIYYSDCPSVCPETIRQWHKLPELEATLDKFTTHKRHLIGDDQGYVVLVPDGMTIGNIYNPLGHHGCTAARPDARNGSSN